MIRPPMKFKICMKCKKPFFHRPKSDALMPSDIISLCSACQKGDKKSDENGILHLLKEFLKLK